ncbi:MAG TPA: FAD-dependent oxidoreductase [Acetobacteraceae bacterium]|nr:FAD-dependent oxidoreductase [Acetobacteraceae bacterium]
MIVIKAQDWTLPVFKPEDVVGHCNLSHMTTSITQFYIGANQHDIGDGHDGFMGDAHGDLSHDAQGRYYGRAVVANQLVLRWTIEGFEYVKEADIRIYPHKKEDPVSIIKVNQNSGSHDTLGRCEDAVLTNELQVRLPHNLFTFAAGPYLARICIRNVQQDTKVIVGVRRLYFDVLPVAVVGGGIAGIHSAELMLAKQLDVVLIEARDRLGGRAFTQNWQSLEVDLGCQFYQDADENPLVGVAQTYQHRLFWHRQIEAVRVLEGHKTITEKDDAWRDAGPLATFDECAPDESRWEAIQRYRLSWVLDDLKHDNRAKIVKERDARLLAMSKEKRFESAALSAIREEHGDRVEQEVVKDMELEETAKVRLEKMLNSRLVHLVDAMIAELDESTESNNFTQAEEEDEDQEEGGLEGEESISTENREESVSKEPAFDPGTSNKMSEQGYGTLFQVHLKAIQVKYQALLSIFVSEPVETIEVRQAQVLLPLKRGVLHAWGVIISVPTEVIRQKCITFAPTLPIEIVKAFDLLPMGHYKKVFLQLDPSSLAAKQLHDIAAQKAKEAEQEKLRLQKSQIIDKAMKQEKEQQPMPDIRTDLSLYTITQANVPWKFVCNLSQNTIVAFVGGEPARELDLGSTGNAVAAACGALGEALDIPNLLKSCRGDPLTSTWSADPFSLGSYSYTRPGGGIEARRTLRTTLVHGRIVFAGEAMRASKEEYATAHGAWLSAEDATKLLGGVTD